MASTCPITAVFPAYERIQDALNTLDLIKACDPRPAEIIVHVDGGAYAVADAIAAAHPDVRIITSDVFVGPGGARNRLVEEASHELVANFDDDSHPEHPDYFARVMDDFRLFPEMAALSASSQQLEKDMPGFMDFAILSGCGCVFRKSWFKRISGFVPLRIAYCMEEVDVSLQLHEIGGRLIHDPGLHVKHLKTLPIKPDAEVSAAILANTALFPYLRYPPILWPLGLWQVVSRILYICKTDRGRGLRRGLSLVMVNFKKYRAYKRTIPSTKIISWYRLRRNPVLLKTTGEKTSHRESADGGC